MSASLMPFVLDNLSDLRVREKLLRLCQHLAIFASPHLAPHNQAKLDRISCDIGLARLVFRSFDELPKLRTTFVTYHNKPRQNCGALDRLMWLLSVLGNVCDSLYYPAEKIAWLWPANPRAASCKTVATKLWVMSLFCTILRTLLTMRQLKRDKKLGSSEERGKLYRQQVLTLIMSAADFKNGMTMLYSSTGSRSQIGALGSLSSLLGLYSVLRAKRQQLLDERRMIARARGILE
ncbi:peroxisomal membrane protein 11C [Hyalella azteca]|uniref:Peroxisomal membrane protein 11C n=1 Tax=Hyalella azteca TaxID=294128 RepID=A0A8B7NMB7_HYAAZ|nr:peroxisomal membrane protein 11C [Hyalella azteca]